MITGTHLLPDQRSRTSETVPMDDICQMCKLKKEDIVHLLTRCSETILPRTDDVRELKLLIDNELGETFWGKSHQNKLCGLCASYSGQLLRH